MSKTLEKNRELIEFVSIARKHQLKELFTRPSPVVVQLFADIAYQVVYNKATTIQPEARERLSKYKKSLHQLAAKTRVTKAAKARLIASKGHLFLSDLSLVILQQTDQPTTTNAITTIFNKPPAKQTIKRKAIDNKDNLAAVVIDPTPKKKQKSVEKSKHSPKSKASPADDPAVVIIEESDDSDSADTETEPEEESDEESSDNDGEDTNNINGKQR